MANVQQSDVSRCGRMVMAHDITFSWCSIYRHFTQRNNNNNTTTKHTLTESSSQPKQFQTCIQKMLAQIDIVSDEEKFCL